jgi:hypothetical protein
MHRVRLLLLLGLVLAVGATSVAKDQGQKDRDSKHDKAKNKDNDGHRKHWWSPPHLGHKKHGSDSNASQKGTNSSSKTVAANPMTKTAASSKPGNKTVGATNPGQKTGAKTGQGKKTVRHDCSPEEAKKGGCQVDKGRTQKASASPS